MFMQSDAGSMRGSLLTDKEFNMIYQVLEQGKPAKFPNCNVHSSWNNNEFVSLDEAIDYTIKWLGDYYPLKGRNFPLNTKVVFAGTEDGDYYMEIKTVDHIE